MAERPDPKTKLGGWGDRWKHGRVHYDASGEPTYFIEARRQGRYFMRSTGVHTEHEALAEWTRFLDDPSAYLSRPARKASAAAAKVASDPEALTIDDALVNEYLAWCAGEGQSQAWRTKKRRLLAWWAGKLFGQNLRGLDKRNILSCVPKGHTTSRPHKIAVLKALYEYLRNPEQRLATHPDRPTLTAGEDPMIDFKVPQAAPAQSKGKKPPIPIDHLWLVLESLTGAIHRHALTFLIGTGWRGTEVPRFAAEGVIDPPTVGQTKAGVLAVISVYSAKARQRRWKPVQVTNPRLLTAAKALREHGRFDLSKLDKAIRSACEARGIKPFGYGSIRHTVKGWTKEHGADSVHVAQAMGHSIEVAERVYGQSSAAPPLPSPLDAMR